MRRLGFAAALVMLFALAWLNTLPTQVQAHNATPPATTDLASLQPIEQEAEPIPLTDPAQLAAMGFPANAQNVFVHPGVVSGTRPPQTAVETFGSGANANYTSVAAKDFIGRQDTAAAPWQYSGGVTDCCDNLSRLGTEEFADAEIKLPPGVALQSIRYWAVDINAVDDMFFSIMQTCLPIASGGPATVTVLAQGQTTGATGYQGGLLAGGAVTLNQRDCTLKARVRFPATTGLTFQKLRLEWRRQVSPSPGVATFTDVPTNHFFFRYIEALYAAGITAGCGNGQFCPDAPVTRAQMAVFLSVALGLSSQ